MGVGAVATLLVADEVEHRKLPQLYSQFNLPTGTKVSGRSLYAAPQLRKYLHNDDVLCSILHAMGLLKIGGASLSSLLFSPPVLWLTIACYDTKNSQLCRMNSDYVVFVAELK
jgi:hypothetical protein